MSFAGGNVISFDVGTVHLGVAASTVTPDGDATLAWLDTADISAACADRCVSKLWTYLDDLLATLGWTRFTALIERQPAKACSLMRSVELGIRHYFLMWSHKRLGVVSVKSVSPRRKLSAPVRYAAGASKGQQYKARKAAGLSEAVAALGALPEAVAFLQTGKGDDAADALLYHIQFFNARRFVACGEHALRNAAARAAAKQAERDSKAAAKQAERDLKAAAKQAERDLKAAAKQAERDAKAAARQAERAKHEPVAAEPGPGDVRDPEPAALQ